MTKGRGGSGWMPVFVYPVLSGIVLAAAFPPLPLGFLACVGLIPLFLSVERLRGRAAFGAGFLHGVVFYSATLYWISWITPPGTAGAIVYLSFFRGLLAWALSAVVNRFRALGLWSAAFLWVGFEYFNTLGDMGFPWVVLGHSQSAYLPLIQYAEVTGVYGVSFWVVVVNLAVLALIRSEGGRRMAVGTALALLLAVPGLHGARVLMNAPGPEAELPVVVIQPNMPPSAKEYRGFSYNIGVLEPITTRALAEHEAKLVVWPETAVPAYLDNPGHRAYLAQLQGLVDSLGVYLYTGAYRTVAGPPGQTFNSSFLLTPGGSALPYYDKIKLVPFGERAPFPEVLPFLQDIQFTGGGYVGGNWDSGNERTVFQVPGGRFSGLICFDSVFPWLVREFVLEGAQFLVVITNDGWFGRTSGPYQHAEAAVFRAIENRRAVVRCANTGVSSLIDAFGRQEETTGIFHEAILYGRVGVRSGMTFYTRYGDVFSQVCTGLSVLVLLVTGFRRAGKDEEITPRPARASVPQGEAPEEEMEEAAMPFLDHLEELRWRILKGLGAVAVGAAVCGIFVDEILRALTLPARQMEVPVQLITLKPMGMFLVKLNIVLVGGGILALPVLLYQLWLFVAPGLYRTERRYVAFIILSSTVCFVVGGMVAYWGVVPLAMMFLVGMTSGTDIAAQFDIGMYIGFVLRLLIAFGVVFELPVATFFLTKVGILTAARMRSGRRYAILTAVILAAILTPPDPISQLMMAVPLVILYEFSIWVSHVARREPENA